jgi:hypothetical protein
MFCVSLRGFSVLRASILTFHLGFPLKFYGPGYFRHFECKKLVLRVTTSVISCQNLLRFGPTAIGNEPSRYFQSEIC